MRKFGAILLAFILTLSNIGMAFSTHYCGGKAVETSILIGNSSLGCGMEEEAQPCAPTPSQTEIGKAPCCDDQRHYIGVKQVVKTGAILLSVSDLAIHYSGNTHFELHSSLKRFTKYVFADLPPPFWEVDRRILFQSFLI